MQPKGEVNGFAELLQRFERNISILGRSPRTFDNYSRHIAAMALHFGCLPTELDEDQIKDYLYELQQRSKTPSQTYFKHTVYGLRFMLKGEGLPYSHLHLPSIKRDKKLPTVLSSTWKRGKLQALQSELKVKRPEAKAKTLLRKCPCCKTGTMITIEVFGKRGPPEKYLMENKLCL
ncbi:MAG: phage integrase N-terminal SAM-like domain-containing protein [Sphingobacteriales bacterium]|nr:phage integrase N-terminal SAM-like domain-containing protein [Sphingobacteriales bacterium]